MISVIDHAQKLQQKLVNLRVLREFNRIDCSVVCVIVHAMINEQVNGIDHSVTI